jgi:small multidrug resistance pump
MLESYFCAYLAVLFTAMSQVLMKAGSVGSAGRHWLRSYLNVRTLGAYFLLFATTILNTYAYRRLQLRVAVIVLPVTFILVGVFSIVFFKERLSKRQLAGACAIIAGIVIYNL